MSNPVDVLTLIAEHWTELQGHAVSGVWVFGSAARGELRPDSDIDLLVEFDRPVSLFEFARLRGHLQTWKNWIIPPRPTRCWNSICLPGCEN